MEEFLKERFGMRCLNTLLVQNRLKSQVMYGIKVHVMRFQDIGSLVFLSRQILRLFYEY